MSSPTTPDRAPPVAAAVHRLLEDDWRDLQAYRKWQGAHWRLLSLVDLGQGHDPRLGHLLDHDLAWLRSPHHRGSITTVAGRVRRCASQEGAAVLVATAMGRATDDDVTGLAHDLVRWQWPDGGWNCDTAPGASHSSLHETWLPLRALAAWSAATHDAEARAAADRAGTFLVSHRVVRSHRTGLVVDPAMLHLHWPPYWRLDLLQGLRCLADLDRLAEVPDAVALLLDRRAADGTWRVSGRRWWRPPGSRGSGVDVVDWHGIDDEVVTDQARAVVDRTGG